MKLNTAQTHSAFALLSVAAMLLAAMIYAATISSGDVVREQHAGASITFATEHPAVMWNTSCVMLSWSLKDISGVWLDDTPTVGENRESWCLPTPDTYRGFYRDPAYPDLRVQFTNGEVRHYRLPIYVMQPFIERLVLPLVGIALLVYASQWLPAAFVAYIARPRPLAPSISRFTDTNGRKYVGVVALVGAFLVLAGIIYRVTLAPPYTLTHTNQDTLFSITVDPPSVLGSNGCTTLAWEVDNANRLQLDGRDLPLTGSERYCLPPRSTASIIQFEYEREDGHIHRRTVRIMAMQPFIYTLMLPLLLLGAICLLPLRWRLPNWLFFSPFYDDDHTNDTNGRRLHAPLLITFAAIVLLSTTNIIRHNARLAYDAEDHFLYPLILADNRLPTPAETNQFFAPPLVYVFPSLVHRMATSIGMEPCSGFNGGEPTCQITAKAGQLQNIIPALGIPYLLILIAGQIGGHSLKLPSLMMLGILPVYYKALVFHRGEPFTTLLVMLLVHRLLLMHPEDRQPTIRGALIFGLGTGLLAITRQWGILAIGGMGLWALITIIQRGRSGFPLLRVGLIGYGIALVSGGWYYGLTALRFGSVTAFNRAVDIEPKSLEFFIGLGSGKLFTEAFRSSRIRQIIPIFYSDTWGDYWGHYYLASVDFSVWSARPPEPAIAYLSRANLVSLAPTIILLFGLGVGIAHIYLWLRYRQSTNIAYALLTMIILTSLGGYLWFLTRYPDSVGDTIKAAYMLHIFPLLAILTGQFLLSLRQWNGWLYVITAAAMLGTWLHHIPLLLPHYTGS